MMSCYLCLSSLIYVGINRVQSIELLLHVEMSSRGPSQCIFISAAPSMTINILSNPNQLNLKTLLPYWKEYWHCTPVKVHASPSSYPYHLKLVPNLISVLVMIDLDISHGFTSLLVFLALPILREEKLKVQASCEVRSLKNCV